MIHGLLTAALVDAEVETPQWSHIDSFTKWCDDNGWSWSLESKTRIFNDKERYFMFWVRQDGLSLNGDGKTAPEAVFNTMRKLYDRVRP